MFRDFHGKKCGFSLIFMGNMWIFMDFNGKYVDLW